MNSCYMPLENLNLTDLDNALTEYQSVLELTSYDSKIYKSRFALLARREAEVKAFKEKWYCSHIALTNLQLELSMLLEAIEDSKDLLVAVNLLENNLNNPHFDGIYPFAADFRSVIYSYQHKARDIAYQFFNKHTSEKAFPGGIYEKKLLTQMTTSVNEIYKNPFDVNARHEFFRACNQFPAHERTLIEKIEPVLLTVAFFLSVFAMVVPVALLAGVPGWLMVSAGVSFALTMLLSPMLIDTPADRSETRLRHESGLHETLKETANVYKKVSPLRQHSIMRMPLPSAPPAYEAQPELAFRA
jgi:hypothetical protein